MKLKVEIDTDSVGAYLPWEKRFLAAQLMGKFQRTSFVKTLKANNELVTAERRIGHTPFSRFSVLAVAPLYFRISQSTILSPRAVLSLSVIS